MLHESLCSKLSADELRLSPSMQCCKVPHIPRNTSGELSVIYTTLLTRSLNTLTHVCVVQRPGTQARDHTSCLLVPTHHPPNHLTFTVPKFTLAHRSPFTSAVSCPSSIKPAAPPSPVSRISYLPSCDALSSKIQSSDPFACIAQRGVDGLRASLGNLGGAIFAGSHA